MRQVHPRTRPLSIVVLFLIFSRGICQDSSYSVPPEVHPTKIIPIAARYQYSKFQSGILYFATGEKSDQFLLNYNHFAQEFQLIDSNGDTVALDNEASIVEFIQVQSDFYFRDLRQGYFQVLTKEEPLNLLKRIYWNSIDFPDGQKSYQKLYDYFFLAPSNRVHRAEKGPLLKLFPNYKKEVSKYLADHKIDFTRESDLRRVVAFCNGLATNSGRK